MGILVITVLVCYEMFDNKDKQYTFAKDANLIYSFV